MLINGNQYCFLSCIFSKLFFKKQCWKKQAGFRLFVFRQCVPNDLFQNCLLIKWLGSFWFILPYCVLHITNLCIFFSRTNSLILCLNCTWIVYSKNQDSKRPTAGNKGLYIVWDIYSLIRKKTFLQLTSNDLIPKVFKTINTVVYSFYKYFFL